jgi:hypothetical protein
MNENTKVKIVAIEELTGEGLNQAWVKRYVGFTSRDENTFLSEFKSGKNQKTISTKINIANINPSRIRSSFLGAAFLKTANERVNFYIEKYNTINNGWNTVER